MKNMIALALITMFFSNLSVAQDVIVGGYRRAGTNEQIKAMHTDKLKDSLGLTTEQAKKVDAIEQDYNLRIRAVKMDTRLSDSAKNAAIRPLEIEKKGNLLEAINEKQLAKLEGRKLQTPKQEFKKTGMKSKKNKRKIKH
jgi:hypothetical protein